MNLHTPERGANESRDDYKARRASARDALQRATLAGKHKLRGEISRQAHRNLLRENGNMAKHAGSYGRGLRNWINNENRQRQASSRAGV